MVAKKKRNTLRNRKKPSLKKNSISSRKTQKLNLNFKNNSFLLFLNKFLKFPYIFINKVGSLIVDILIVIFASIKKIFFLLFKIKEAFFGVVFGFLSGSIAAIIIYSYLDFNSQIDKNFSEQYIIKNSNVEKQLLDLEEKVNTILVQNASNEKFIKKITGIESKLNSNIVYSEENLNKISAANQEIKLIVSQSVKMEDGLKKLKQEIKNNSKLMMSSSKTELSNRLYLAQSLVDRLKSGVPYAPQLVSLGEEGLDPALLRYAKGGAPTMADLAARLSVRAGELRDADKTKRDINWRDNLKSEISKYVKIKPTDIKNIKGTSGALLRAEDAISRGNLELAINEVNSLKKSSRGVLDAWLEEAKARQDANIAANNLLAKTTAALRKRN